MYREPLLFKKILYQLFVGIITNKNSVYLLLVKTVFMINIKPIIESFGKDHIKIKINLFHTFINLDQTKRSNESHDILN